jgi:hypothetical protein
VEPVSSRPPRARPGAGSGAGSGSARTTQITDTDRALLAFAAEHRFVIAAQVAVLLGVSQRTAGERLRRLSDAGHVRRHKELHRGPGWHQITRAGLRAIDGDLPAPRGFDLATHRHDTGLAWLMLTAKAGRFGALAGVISERRMRSHDGRTADRSQRYGVRLGGVGPAGRDRLHYPDLVIVTQTGHRVAFELERSTKEVERRERILAGYAADRRIDAVVYLVEQPSVGRAIERSARRMGISDLVRVQRVSMVSGVSGQGPARAPTAARPRAAHVAEREPDR